MMALILFLAALLLLLLPLWKLGRIREVHHGYLGLLLAAFGVLAGDWWLLLAACGAWVWADDTVQHWRQVLGEPAYLSPLHRGYGWVYARVALVRGLNAWLDHVLGKTA
jgi:hypothetical protein